MKIDISGLPKPELLAALYNASRPLGLGRYADEATCEKRGSVNMGSAEAANVLGQMGTRFDYLMGRVMKLDVGADEMEAALYDRDNGEGAAERTVEALRARLLLGAG